MSELRNDGADPDAPVHDTLGRELRDLRVSVTDRCNLNCTYCMPDKTIQFLPKNEILSFEEIVRVVRVCRTLGVRKVKITGGEPTLRIGMHKLVEQIVNLRFDDVALITNGVFLAALAPRLKAAGLKRLTVSLDAIDKRLFRDIVGGVNSLHPVLRGIERARELGFDPIKINCVLQKGINENQILPMADYCRERGIHLRFIEFMDVGDVEWNADAVVTSAEILRVIEQKHSLRPVSPAYCGEVAVRYAYTDVPCEVGFISSVSQPFCRDCTRLRLTADGTLYGCLFTSAGMSVRDLMRRGVDDAELVEAVRDFWHHRSDRYSEIRAERRAVRTPSDDKKPAMSFIGG